MKAPKRDNHSLRNRVTLSFGALSPKGEKAVY
jgi:hypothetical protein